MRVPLTSISALLIFCVAAGVPLVHAGLKDWLKEQINQPAAVRQPDANTVAAGLREALEKGTQRAIEELGQENGFWLHPSLRIPVPERLQRVDRTLRRFGQDKIADDFIRSLNRAAEQATPVARDIFLKAVRQITISDAVDILRGPPDAATAYFRRQTGEQLTVAFRPIVQRSTESVGVTAQYKRFVKKAEPLGVVDTRDLDIDAYVTQKALDSLFRVIASEEGRIRADPAARTTELLRKVFQ